jgi:diaminohydroxyphosphoribosylaminopyrimidine deaminase/5-amino-6-(5-phosphoribosylamino)uracil reductase
MTSTNEDERHMRHALRLAGRALGRVAPNPAVGCVIVSPDGVVVGRGWTAPGGRPHAETVALEQASTRAKGATAYVTLEPCAHHGVTPPCADALASAGIKLVVAAVTDTDPRVNGAGFKKLEAANVLVAPGVCEQEARELNAGFFHRIEHGRPLVALKSAESVDGFVASDDPNEKWITSEEARRHGHLLRAKHDAILIGIETALADNPLLNCRLEGLEDRSPIRVVLDSHLRLPVDSKLIKSTYAHRLIIFASSAEGAARAATSTVGLANMEMVFVESDDEGRLNLAQVLSALAERGITRLLVEGGPTVQRSFITTGLVDVVYRYRAPHSLGAGRPSGVSDMLENIEPADRRRLGPDLLEVFRTTV